MLAVVVTLLLAATSPDVELQKAVMSNDIQRTRNLLTEGASQQLGGQSCLMIAGYIGDITMVDLLLEFIPDHARLEYINKKGTVGDNHGNALLFTLLGAEEKTEPGQRDLIIEKLVRGGIDLHSKDSRGRTPMMIAFALADMNLIKPLALHDSFSKELGHKSSSGPFKGRNAVSFLMDAARLYVQTCTNLLHYTNKGQRSGKRTTRMADDFIKANNHTWAMHSRDHKTCSTELWTVVDQFISNNLDQLFQLEGASTYWTCKRLFKIKPKTITKSNIETNNIIEGKLRDSKCEQKKESTCEPPIDSDETIPIVQDITQQEFHQHYYSKKKPLIIKDATRDWSCSEWDISTVKNHLGAISTTIAEIPYASQYGLPMKQTTYNQFIDNHIQDDSHWYAFDNNLHSKHKQSVSYFKRHSVTEKKSFNPPQWSFGGDGSGSPPHFHQDAFNGICFGKKIWKIWPPESSFISTMTAKDVFEHADEFPPHITTVQHAGDLMYIPKGWGHAILNVGVTLAVAVEYY
eukprot:TRINITY_DN18747_c0_g1_i2.p1 TRINITY_DN18747_c0_g1~~TRINITY_DN18747_c0_g1_i2.p1  ORF type:complete len:518 (+),score=91.60 TRINITY_DN18747_c0_g1_i2:107-1660(+)